MGFFGPSPEEKARYLASGKEQLKEALGFFEQARKCEKDKILLDEKLTDGGNKLILAEHFFEKAKEKDAVDNIKKSYKIVADISVDSCPETAALGLNTFIALYRVFLREQGVEI